MALETVTFPWQETRERLHELEKERPLVVADQGRVPCLVDDAETPTVRVWLPFALLPRPLEAGLSIAQVLDVLPEAPGTGVIVLVRAGSTALGIWRGDELLRHKVIKRYVVRGNGRAQPLHLKTRGKSRHGSRIRLQGYKAQLEETIARLLEWREEFGKPDQFLFSCPKRILGDLRQMDPPLPTDAELTRIPFEVRESSFDELVRIRRRTEWGRIEIVKPDPPDDSSPDDSDDPGDRAMEGPDTPMHPNPAADPAIGGDSAGVGREAGPPAGEG